MSEREVKSYEWRCDRHPCKARTVGYSLPKGWTQDHGETQDCGLTGYTRRWTRHYCPEHRTPESKFGASDTTGKGE
jgi:hypothetical protein